MPAALPSPGGGCRQIGGDTLIGLDRRSRPMPGSAILIRDGVHRGRERQMGLAAQGVRGARIHSRPNELVPERDLRADPQH